MKEYDVIVVGGGTAGVVAALQAGRAGARTLLVEKTGILGGTMTNAGVNFPGLFHAWGKQVIAGIGWELVTRAVEEMDATLPDFSTWDQGHHARLQVRVNKFLYAALCDEALVESGVDILFHSMPFSVESGDGTAWKVLFSGKRGVHARKCKVLVDATGDASIVSFAGYKLNVPDETQPATLSCSASGYTFEDLDLEAINVAIVKEVEAGRMCITDAGWNTEKPNVGQWLRSRGANASHVHHINAGDSEGKSKLELEARKGLLRLVRFLRTQPGLENLVIDSVSPECGVRETATIHGETVITADDYRTGRIWEDSLCHAFYPIDLHRSDGDGLGKEPLKEGVVPTVPRGALLPKGSRNLLVAGRCVSSDRLANSALRVEASCMAMGQAAGAMAALAAKFGTDPRDLAVSDIHNLLAQHGAIVPKETD